MKLSRAALALFLFASVCRAADYYASPTGSGSTCSLAAPCSLATGLTKPTAGDKLWLRGGTYGGAFTSNLNGTSSNPITVRNYNGERAILDSGINNSGGNAGLVLNGSYVWIWGLEFTDSDTNRPHTALSRQPGISSYSPGSKIINCIIHDTGQGIGWWEGATNSEVNGTIIYYNGSHDRDHGIYAQNRTAGTTKIAKDIIAGFNSDHGVHYYGSGSFYGMQLIGSTVFSNGGGYFGSGPGVRNFLIDGATNTDGLVDSNVFYYPQNDPSSATMLGMGTAFTRFTFTNNYNASPLWFDSTSGVTMTGNTVYGRLQPTSLSSTFPSNTYVARPGAMADKIVVRPNQYEPGRCNVTIVNWSKAASKSVDLTACGLAQNQSYKVVFALNFFGSSVATGTYSTATKTVTIPMNAAMPAPVGSGWSAPASMFPELGVFVVLPTGAVTPQPTATAIASTPTASPTRTASPSATATQTPTRTWTPTLTSPPPPASPTPTPTPGSVCATVTPACVMVTVTP